MAILASIFLLAQLAPAAAGGAPVALAAPAAAAAPERHWFFVIGDRSDVRAFSYPGRDPEMDLTTTLLTSLNLRATSVDLFATYLPGLAYVDVNHPDRSFGFQQAGRLRLTLSLDLRRWTFSAYADASYTAGDAVLLNQFLPVVPAAAATGERGVAGLTTGASTTTNAAVPTAYGLAQVVPPSVTVKLGTAGGGVGLGYTFTPRLSLSNNAFVTGQRGFGYYSQILSPTVLTIGVGTRLEYQLTTRDSVFSRVTGSYSTTTIPALSDTIPENNTKAVIVTAAGGYRRQWSPRTSGSVSLGVSVGTLSSGTDNGNGATTSLFSEASVYHVAPLSRSLSLNLRAAAQYGLAATPYYGGLQNQVTGVGSAGLLGQRASLTLSVTGTTTVASNPETQMLAAALVGTYQPLPYLYFYTGSTLSRTVLPGQTIVALDRTGQPITADGRLDWTAFLGVGVTAPAIAF